MQLALPLSNPQDYTLDNFVISDSNRFAYERIKSTDDWPVSGVILSGESGCGKTHLLEVWKANNNDALCLENIETWQEEPLFHAYNKAIQNKQKMLFTSRVPPAQLDITLADLVSRLSAMTHTAIAPADDLLLLRFIKKQFETRQLDVDTDIASDIITYAPRSYGAILDVIEQLDQQSLTEKRPINRRMVRNLFNL